MSLKRLSAFILAGLLLLSSPGATVFASNINDLKNKASQLDQETTEARRKLKETQNLKDLTLQDIDEYDRIMGGLTEEIDYIEVQIDVYSDLLEETTIELEQAEEARDAQYEVFKQRARYMYINGKMSYLDIIFKAESFSDMMKRFDTVNRIVKYDTEIVQKLQEAEEAVAQKVEETTKQKNDLEVLHFSQTESLNEYEELRKAKQALVEELREREQEQAAMVSELEKSSKSVEDEIRKYQEEQARIAAANNQPIYYDYDGTQLMWPVPSKSEVSSGYINRVSPISGKKEFHTGIDIPASYGAAIVAAEAGTVITAGWMNGYGYTVVVDHGNGMSTLYGHNSSLVASKGDKVVRGQTIAKCGSTGYSTGNHCHFEVRIFGTPVNPNPYVGR